MGLADEHYLHRMGGLRRELPVVFWTFLVGAAVARGPAPGDGGFLQQGFHLESGLGSSPGGPLLWAAGLGGAFLTGLYSFRMVFLAFFGEAKHP